MIIDATPAYKWRHQQLKKSSGWQLLSLEETAAALEQMTELPSVDNFICILQQCRKQKNLPCAKRVHMHIRDNGLEPHTVLGNYLVPMFVECGSMNDAQQVFDRLLVRNEYSWTSLIQGYIVCGELEHALKLFQKMQEDCIKPSRHTFVALLKAYSKLKNLKLGRETHVEIAKQGFELDPFIGSILVDMYAKGGSIVEAWEVFEKLPMRNVVSWTALIAGYAELGLGQPALNCLERMQLEGVSPNAVTFVCSLKACDSLGATDRSQGIHAEIVKEGFERDPFVGSILVDMYAKCGSIVEAQEVFDKLLVRDAVLWNALLSGYAERALGEEALNCLERMQLESVLPNAVTSACSLKACGTIGATERGLEIHARIFRQGFGGDPAVGNTLVDMYVKCGLLAEAGDVFDELPVRNVVSWTAMIRGYTERGRGDEALNCFQKMQREGVSPDAVTFIFTLKACGSLGSVDKGREIHSKITKEGFETDEFVVSTLVDMYAKCGSLAEAWKVLDKLPVQHIVARNALIAGCAECGLGEAALVCLEWMQQEGMPLDAVTFVCSLKACCSIGAIDMGREIHAEIAKRGCESEPLFGSAVVDMYAKCGSLAEAQEVFDKLPVQNVVSWTTLLAGHAHQGDSELVLYLFERMREDGIQPNGFTFLSVLTSCSHAGLVEKGQKYFDVMTKEHGVVATIQHYNCMIDLLGRAGQLKEAVAMLEKMPFQPDLITWTTVLSACRKWGNIELGRKAFECAVRLDEKCTAAFILMSNIYTDAQMWDDVKKIEEMRVNV